MDLLVTARQVVRDRFGPVRAAVLAGSAGAGRAGPLSDLDVVVVLDGPPAPYRETIRAGGRPVELFVHTQASVEHWYALEREQGVVVLADMLATGRPVAGPEVSAIQAAARAHVAAGPPAWTPEQVEYRRYAVTDALDDLVAAEDDDERDAVAGQLLALVTELRLATAGAWRGRGKWQVRRLRACDPDWARQVMAGHRTAVATGDVGPLVVACDRLLDTLGGRLTEGFSVRSSSG